MKIIVKAPKNAIRKYRSDPNNYTDIEAFYCEKLPLALDDMGVDYEIVDRWDDISEPNSIELLWHTMGDAKNTWYVKSGYLPNYFYFDKSGYSGWSTLVHNYKCDVDAETAKNFVESFPFRSRMPQADYVEDILSPYVLVLGQKWLDNVMELSYFKGDLFDKVAKLYESTEYNVVFKPHPLNEGSAGVHGNLQDLIAGATAIYVMNSGSGFEALFQGKRVFTTGICDYHWATTPLKTEKEFQNSKNLLDEPVDIDRINKFLYYCMTEYFMDINDMGSIQKKIRQAISQAS
jgi:hypothetical protein